MPYASMKGSTQSLHNAFAHDASLQLCLRQQLDKPFKLRFASVSKSHAIAVGGLRSDVLAWKKHHQVIFHGLFDHASAC